MLPSVALCEYIVEENAALCEKGTQNKKGNEKKEQVNDKRTILSHYKGVFESSMYVGNTTTVTKFC